MEKISRRELLEKIGQLEQGIHPDTGEIIDASNDLYNAPFFKSLLSYAKKSITKSIEREERLANKKRELQAGGATNAFMMWTKEEDSELTSEFEKNKDIDELAKLHRRTPHAIELRLKYLELE